MSMKSPEKRRGASWPPAGTRSRAHSTAARDTVGPAAKTQDVVWLMTAPLRASRARSK